MNSQPGGRRPDWLSKHLLPIAGAVVSAILVTALTPLGENLRELLFPTKADVSGSVSIPGAQSAGATLVLDQEPKGAVEDDGTFFIPDVGDGDHTLVIKAVSSRPKRYRFTVDRQASEKTLGNIPLQPIAALGYVETLVGPSTWSATVSIQATRDVLRRIQSVEYTLSAPFSTSFTVTERETGFCRQVTSEGAQAGGIPNPSAEVKLRGGRSFLLGWAFFGAASCQQGGTPVPPPSSSPPPPPPQPPPPPPPPPPPSPTTQVPNVIDQPYAEAASQVQGAGFQVARSDVESSKPKDSVVDQKPRGGAELALNGTVTLYVSKGPTQGKVPDVTSQDEASARQALQQYGFGVDVQGQDTTDPNQDGIVLSQKPRGGTRANAGATVTIMVGRFVVPPPP